ncbi:hypothetical protein CP968_00205 [Streptomyces subrutilus]|uniref:Uncharacterized protein n=1 Tax=Streptomyces subrutilus TaxID=36818 RepID=A0A5P2UDC5_9ACTN|nr:hypothetical protein CP968_00205 [Streptomyces subrutilus]
MAFAVPEEEGPRCSCGLASGAMACRADRAAALWWAGPRPPWRGGLVRRGGSEAAPDGWEGRDWRGAPGPFCAAGTDHYFAGRRCASRLVAYEDGCGTGFVRRQPVRASPVRELTCASGRDPPAWACLGHGGRGLGRYLCGYAFRWAEGGPAGSGARLPEPDA